MRRPTRGAGMMMHSSNQAGPASGGVLGRPRGKAHQRTPPSPPHPTANAVLLLNFTLAWAQERRMMVSSVRTVTGSDLTSWLLRRSA